MSVLLVGVALVWSALAFPGLAFPGLAFPGLSESALLSSLLGAALLTTALYFLRLRRRPVLVAFLPLFESLLLDSKATAWRSRLQRFMSLLLSLLLVAALIFALADPAPTTDQRGRHVVVLLDVGASMAQQEHGVTRLAEAKKRIRSWLKSFVGGDQMLLVEMGVRPRPVAPFTARMAELEQRLSDVTSLDVHSELGPALRYARDVLSGKTKPQIVVVSTGALAIPPGLTAEDFPPISFESVAPAEASTSRDGLAARDEPAARDNLAVSTFAARRYPHTTDRFEVLVEAVHRGERARPVELTVFAADERGNKSTVLDVSRIEVEPDSVVSRSFDNLAQAEHGLLTELRYLDPPAEEFTQDNLARTLLAPRPPVSILVVGPPNTFLEAALLVEDGFRVTRVSGDAYPPAGEFDVTIFDGTFVARAATGAAIYLGAPAREQAEYPVERAGRLQMFGFDTWDEKSSVFRLVDPYNVQVLEGQELVPAGADQVLGRSAGRPIFVSGERAEGRFLALGFSPTQSDFVLRAVWPLFVVNLIDEVFPRGRGDAMLSYATGQVWRPPVLAQAGETSARIVGPLHLPHPPERVVPVADGRAVLFGERAGFFEAKTSQGTMRFAASLPALPQESAMAQRQLRLFADQALPEVSGMQPRATRKPWYWLLVLVFTVSFLEWWTFHRRWTV